MGTTSPLMPAPGTPVGGAQAPAIATAPVNANVVMTVLSIIRVLIVESNTTQTKELTDMNWNTWKGSMKRIFGLCNLTKYVLSNVICPDPGHDPVSTKNWDFNDSYTAMLMCKNISVSQKVYCYVLTLPLPFFILRRPFTLLPTRLPTPGTALP